MKHLRLFENFDEFDTWENIQSSFDVYQLYELLVFKYGPIFKDTKQAIDEYEDHYNPDHIYEIIEMELKFQKSGKISYKIGKNIKMKKRKQTHFIGNIERKCLMNCQGSLTKMMILNFKGKNL